MLEKIISIVRKSLDIDEDYVLTAEMGPDDIEEWDSFGMINLFSDLEKELGIKFAFDEMVSISTIDDIVKIAEQKYID